MRKEFVTLLFILVFSLGFVISTFSHNIEIRRILNTESYNQCIVEDKDGMLWIVTERNGLFCYNGNELKKVRIFDEDAFKTIYSIFVDREGVIWFFMEGEGLYSFNKEKNIFKKYQYDQKSQNSLTSSSVHWLPCNITEDKEGFIWIGTIDGLNSYDKKTDKITQYKHSPDNPNSLSNNSVCTVFVDKEGLIWIGTEDGLNCYDKNTGKFSHYKHDSNNPRSISDDYIRAITEDKEGNLWIGTENTGIDKFDKKTGQFTNYRHNPGNKNSLSYNEIHHLMVDRYNNLWICNEGNVGLDIYNIKEATFSHYSYDPANLNSLGSNIRLYSFEDNSGIVWVTDNYGGLNKCTLHENIFKNYTYNPKDNFGLSSDGVASVYEDIKGNIWIGTYRGGLCLYTKNGKFENFNHDSSRSSLPGVSVHSILNATEDKLWLGVKEGFICLFDIETKQVIKKNQNPYFNLTPAYLTQDNQNPDILWFACSHAGGVFKFNKTTYEITQYKNIPNNVNSVSNRSSTNLLQEEDILWVGTGGDGLCKFNKTTGKCTYYRHNPSDETSISGNIVIESFIDSKGNFWNTTDDGGLNKFDKQTEKFTHYGKECGFPSLSTRRILEDNEGCLWIGTDSGIVKFDPEKLKVVRWFTTTDGLPCNQYHKIARPLKDSKGDFWFPAVKGLCKFNPNEANKIKPNSHIPSIVLSSFKSKEGTYNEDGIKKIMNIKLPWPDSSFEFTFAALDYVDPEKNQYAYKLEGFEKDWNYIGNSHFGRYTNVSPGEYVLCLKGSNNDGVWNEEGISIKITITPPFWMTSWFRILIGLTGFLVFGGAVHLRIRALKNKAMRDHAVAEVAGQVAHDIRSPLAALRTALTQIKELSEHNRVLLRTATNRISDIIHNLTVKYDAGEKSGSEIHLKVELISSLLEHLVAEKRSQMSGKSIDLALEINDDAHSCFANLEPGKFKRVISNLINNAAEAIETSNGIIRIVLEKEITATNSLLYEKEHYRGKCSTVVPTVFTQARRLSHINNELRITNPPSPRMGYGEASPPSPNSCTEASHRLSTSSDNSPSTINPPSLGYGEASYQQSTKTLVIKIIDNGKGIPEDILLKIKQGKKASTKKEGQGIGVSSAVKSINTWGGTYDIQSKVGEGTTFIITLPIAQEPDWFQGAIPVSPNTHLVVLDDDESIHRIWESRFRKHIENKTVTIDHFHDPLAFKEYCKSTPTCPAEAKSEGGPVSPQLCEGGSQAKEGLPRRSPFLAKAGETSRSECDLFLVDYELLNANETGLDLIEQLDLRQQAILVTSRYEEDDIRERIKTLGIRIIPKSFAPYIPIVMEKEPAFIGQPDLIFIDNDKFLTDVWELRASSVNKKIAVFNRSEDFKKVMNRYDKSTSIYIDSDLNEKLPGEMFAKFLYYEQGFKTIYLATGYGKDRFPDMPWIKDIVSKEPPF